MNRPSKIKFLKWTIGLSSVLGLITVTAFAREGGVVGNGGHAIACYEDATRSKLNATYLLDYWESGAYTGGFSIDLGPPDLSVQEKIRRAFARIDLYYPGFAQDSLITAIAIADHVDDYLSDLHDLPPTDDANPTGPRLGKNCHFEQFAVQYSVPGTDQRRFMISKRLYADPVTTNDTRAGLLLHEVFFRRAILEGKTSSDGVRIFNAAAADQALDAGKVSEFVKILKRSGMSPQLFHGCQLTRFPGAIDGVVYDRGRFSNGYPKFTELCLTTRYRSGKIAYRADPRSTIDRSSDFLAAVLRVNGEISVKTGGQWYSKSAKVFEDQRKQHWPATFTFDRDQKFPTSFKFEYSESEPDTKLPIEIELESGDRISCAGDIRRESGDPNPRRASDDLGFYYPLDRAGGLLVCQVGAPVTVRLQESPDPVRLVSGTRFALNSRMRVNTMTFDSHSRFRPAPGRPYVAFTGLLRKGDDEILREGELAEPRSITYGGQSYPYRKVIGSWNGEFRTVITRELRNADQFRITWSGSDQLYACVRFLGFYARVKSVNTHKEYITMEKLHFALWPKSDEVRLIKDEVHDLVERLDCESQIDINL